MRSRLLMHVCSGVDMDQGTNTRDHQQEQGTELINQERCFDVQTSGFDEIKIVDAPSGEARCRHFPENQ